MTRISHYTIWLLVCFLALFAWSYHDTLLSLHDAWNSNPDYQHGYFVLPIAVAILWRRREEFQGETRIAWSGLLLIALASFVRWFAVRFFFMELDAWSILLWLGGAFWVAGGFRFFCWALPAIAFLAFATPLPGSVELALSNQLQAIAAAGSAFGLQCLGRPAVLDGTTVLLNGIELDIERACSGLRMFFGVFAIAFGFGMLGKAGKRITTLLVFLAVPVSLLGNIVRIMVTGLLFEITDDQTARQLEHDFAGLAMMVFVLTVFTWVSCQLKWWRLASERRPQVFARRVAFWPIAIAIMIVGVFGLHHVQSGNAVQQLVRMAEDAESAGQRDEAARYWDLVLRMDPNHDDGLRNLSNILGESGDYAARRRALELATRSSNKSPRDLLLAKRRIEIANTLSAHGDTISAANRILTHPDISNVANIEYRKFAARWRANAIYSLLHSLDAPQTLNWQDLGEALETAIEHDPSYPQHYLRLAINYRTRINDRTNAELANSADAIVQLMIDRNPESAEAWLARYRYARQFLAPVLADQAAKATIDGYLDRALQLQQSSETKNAHIFVSVAERERERGNTMASVELYQRAIDVDPADTRPYLAISEMVAEPGNPESLDMSIKVLQDGVRAIGNRELPLILPLIRHLSARGQAEEAERYIDTARRTIEGIPDEQRTEYKIQLGYVEALILARENRFAEAADHLKTMVESFDSNEIRMVRRQIAQVWGNVAQYRRMAGDFTSVVEAYKKAASLDSSWRAHMLQWATRTRSPRKDADAMPQGLAPTSRDPWVDAARFALRQQLLLPPAARDWSQYRHAIESARDDTVMAEVICLDANYHAINGQWEQAEALLRQATIDHPKSPLIFRTLALLHTKQGDLDSAIQLVSEIASEDLQEAALVLLKSELLCTASRYDEALTLLNRATESAPDAELANELQVEVARILTRVGDWEQAKQILSSIRADGEGALRVVEMLSRLAWCQRDWETLEDCENRLRTIEGAKGALWRTCRIRRLLGQSKDRSSQGIVEATALAEALQKDHPDLQMTKVSSARVATYRGLLWEAVSHYENAWQSGSPRVTLAVDLIALLNELGQTDKAQRYVNDARMFMRASDQMIDRTLIDFVYDTDMDAIRFAEAWVQSHESSDGYLRYGRTLALAAIPGIAEEAERLELARRAFEKAVELDPRDIRAWGALYRYYAAARPNPAKAQEVLERLATHEEITELDRAFALAQLRESIGQFAKAAEMYDQSIKLLGDNVDALSHLVVYERSAQFFRSHDLQKAALCSRAALKIDPASIGARAVLIDVLLAQATVDSISEAETLFVSATDDSGLSDPEKRRRAEIKRAKAGVVVGEREQLLSQAVEALESISQKTTNDNLMLALSNIELKMPTAASQQMTLAIVAKNLDVPVLIQFIDEHRELLQSHEAFWPVLERAFLRIEENEGFEIESLRLRLAQLKLSEAHRPESDLENLESLIIDQHTDRCLRRLRVDRERDELVFAVLDFLLKTERVSDAARLAKLSPPPVSRLRWTTMLAVALAMNHSSVADSEEADQLLTDRLHSYPNSGELNFAVGNLRLLRGENAVAVDCYRTALLQNPDHWLTMNNLALALVESNLEESFSLVQKALAVAGRDPVLLDTLALLHLRNDEPQLAIETMQEALPKADFAVTGLIHLAMAWKQVGDTQQAKSTFELIDHAAITAQVLSPIDREMYVALKQELIK